MIETKLSSTITDGYAQGGLIAYKDGDNYVKFDAISDTGQTRINRLELRSEVGGAIQNPTPADPAVPAGTTNIWLRLKKAGTTYSGEYSFDGIEWTPVAVHDAERDGEPELRPLLVRPAGSGRRRCHIVRLLHARRAGPARRGCDCTGPGDDFDGTSLDTEKWNKIVRPDPAKIAFADGDLKVTTVLGDIYTNGDSSGTRNFLLQSADHIGKEDYVLETKVDVSQLNGGYAQGGDPGPRRRRQLHQVRCDLRCQQHEVQPHRAALGAGRGDPEPAAGGHERIPGRRQRRLAAADQDRHDLQGRMVAGRLALDRDGG